MRRDTAPVRPACRGRGRLHAAKFEWPCTTRTCYRLCGAEEWARGFQKLANFVSIANLPHIQGARQASHKKTGSNRLLVEARGRDGPPTHNPSQRRPAWS